MELCTWRGGRCRELASVGDKGVMVVSFKKGVQSIISVGDKKEAWVSFKVGGGVVHMERGV